MNPAVTFGVLILWVGVVLGCQRLFRYQRLWPDRNVLRAHAWLGIAYIGGLISGVWLYGGLGLSDGVRDTLRIASIVAGFLLVSWWIERDERHAREGWWWLWGGLVIPIIVAGWQLVTGQGSTAELGLNRIEGTFSHPNGFGMYLVPFVLVLSAGLGKGKASLILGRLLPALFLTILIALTYSRTALLVLVGGLVLLPVVHAPRLGWPAVRRFVAVSLVVGVVGWGLVGNLVRQRFSGISFGREAWEQAQSGQSENSFEWRLINWGILVTMGLQHPWLGHGIGMTTELNPLISSENGLAINAHNDFVRFFFEGGAVGLLAYVAFGVMICLGALRRARTDEGAEASVAYGVAVAWIAVLFLSFGTTELSLNTPNMYGLYGMLALVRVARTDSQKQVATR